MELEKDNEKKNVRVAVKEKGGKVMKVKQMCMPWREIMEGCRGKLREEKGGRGRMGDAKGADTPGRRATGVCVEEEAEEKKEASQIGGV